MNKFPLIKGRKLPVAVAIPATTSLALAWLATAGISWGGQPAQQKQAASAPGVAEVVADSAERERRLAPPVDLGEPVEESLPLQVVETPTNPAKGGEGDAPVAPADSERTKAGSVDLGEPVTEPGDLQATESPTSETTTVAAESTPPVHAESVDLGEPVVEAPPVAQDVERATAAEAVSSAGPEAQVAQDEAAALARDEAASAQDEPALATEVNGASAATPASAAAAPEQAAAAAQSEVAAVETVAPTDIPEPVPPFIMLGSEVGPGTSTRLSWSPSHSFEGIAAPTPVLVVNGSGPGPVLCLTAAVHGDELNGIEIVRRVLYNLDAEKLSGTVIGVPIVNLQGFRRGSRYLPDRRDLNRFFPGDPSGSSAARIAHSFFNEVIGKCDALVDLHTGSFYRTNLPQLRADLRDKEVLKLSQGFDGTVVLQSAGSPGTLRQAAVNAGIPAVTLEAGEPMRLQEKEVNHGVKTIQSLLGKMGMVKKSAFWGEPEPVYYQSAWVRADQGGILFSEVGLGERVKKDEILGTVTDPITNVRTEILSPYRGRVLGMALNQVVMPGFAAFRIGIQASDAPVIDSTDPESELSSTLHTSEIEEVRTQPPVVEEVEDFDDMEGLEDSE